MTDEQRELFEAIQDELWANHVGFVAEEPDDEAQEQIEREALEAVRDHYDDETLEMPGDEQ
jgi:hypothetical protein